MKAIVFALLACQLFSAISAVDPLCSGVPEDQEHLFPYPTDCTKYWICKNGEKTQGSCPEGLWFNDAVQSCDHPDHSGCTASTPNPSPSPGSCTDNTIVDYLPYPSDCTKYVECYFGEAETRQCPSGLWFHADEKRCTSEEVTECGDGTTISPDPTGNPPTYPTPADVCWGVLPDQTVLKPFPGDCGKFYECEGMIPVEMSCPPYLWFNEAKQWCDWPAVTECDYVPTPGPGPEPTTVAPPDGGDDPRCTDGSTSYWSHPEDCNMYIECYGGHSYEMHCPSGLYFDDRNKKCENPADSGCGGTSPIPNPGTSTHSPDWTPDPDCPWPSTERYLYPYPGDCTKFWECAEGEKVLQVCPAGLFFNPGLMVCDYPYHAGCNY